MILFLIKQKAQVKLVVQEAQAQEAQAQEAQELVVQEALAL